MKIAVCIFLIAQACKLLIKEVTVQGHLNDKLHFVLFFVLIQQATGTDFQFHCRAGMP